MLLSNPRVSEHVSSSVLVFQVLLPVQLLDLFLPAAASTVEAVTELPEEPSAPEVPESVSAGTQNVFKQIAVKSPGRTTGQRRKGSREKKGGGRDG